MDDAQISAFCSELAPVFELVEIVLNFLNQVEVVLLLQAQRKWNVAAAFSIELDRARACIVVV